MARARWRLGQAGPGRSLSVNPIGRIRGHQVVQAEGRERERPDAVIDRVGKLGFVDESGSGRPLSGLFYVARSRARIAIRGGWNARLVASGAAAGGRPLGSTTPDTGSGSVLQLFAHAIELCCVIRTEPTVLLGRLLTMTSTPTTHRPIMIARPIRTPVPCTLTCGWSAVAVAPADVFGRCAQGTSGAAIGLVAGVPGSGV